METGVSISGAGRVCDIVLVTLLAFCLATYAQSWPWSGAYGCFTASEMFELLVGKDFSGPWTVCNSPSNYSPGHSVSSWPFVTTVFGLEVQTGYPWIETSSLEGNNKALFFFIILQPSTRRRRKSIRVPNIVPAVSRDKSGLDRHLIRFVLRLI